MKSHYKQSTESREMQPILSPEFVQSYKSKPVNWGFNGLGYIVYRRTYARQLPNGELEEWYQTIQRCIEGAQKIGAGYTKKEAEQLFDLVFNLKCNFGGRMLWQLGTKTVERFGLNSLLNCFWVAMTEPEDFCFLFENLMLGGGVGYSVKRENIHELPRIKEGVVIKHENAKDADFIVPDSRQGWVELLRKVLDAFYVSGKSFSYSTILVRGAGERIHGFGGSASGPGILIEGMEKIIKIFQSREGKKLRSVDVLDVCNLIGSIVVSGNIRRSATIAIGDPDDYLYIRAKRWDLGNIPNWRSMSNNSIYADHVDQISNEVWEGYQGNGEPYGLINIPLSRKYGRIGEERKDNCTGFNPCITGDTLVYLADGRGHLPIKQLAEEGKDVPVFCLNDNGKLDIRYMRHPRVTGVGQPVYKVTIENGHTFTATGNHKLLLKSGEYKEITELTPGDSLKIVSKFHASIKDIFPKANSRSQDYLWLNEGFKGNKAEHKYIAEFHNNTKIETGYVVHHIDYNAQNNRPENLRIMTKEDHDALHCQNMFGDKNPMRRAATEWSEEKWAEYRKNMSEATAGTENGRYSGYTNEDLKQHALALTKQRGQRFSTSDWSVYAKEHNLPQHFTSWRNNQLGGIKGLAKWAAMELGLEHIDLDPRTVAAYKAMLDAGYDAEIVDGTVMVNKVCEVTGQAFQVPHGQREVSVSSLSAANVRRWRNTEYKKSVMNKIRKTWSEKMQTSRERQTKVLSDLSFKLGRTPMKKEWINECKIRGVSSEISRKTSPFKKYSELLNAASQYNHKVVSVELVGVEDVYNGTVDDFHNFFIGGWEEKTVANKPKFIYINNLQCGEISLEDGEACNLSELYLNNIESEEELQLCTKLLYKTQKAVWTLPALHKKTANVAKRNMRVGLGVTGICQSPDKIKWLDKCYKELRKFDKEWSKERGWPESIKLTTCKPSGTSSLLAGSTPGVHPAYSQYYIRRVRMSSSDGLVPFCKDLGYHVEFVKNFDGTEDHGTVIVSFPCTAGDQATIAKDMTAVKQLDLVKKMQAIWADNAVSVTVYYKKEELPEIKAWLKEHYKNSIKSVSFLLHNEHGFKQAPYEEITKEKYEELSKGIKPIKHGKKTGAGELLDSMEGCAGGVCPIK